MEDRQIVALYWERNERAVDETAAKYGRYCFSIAKHVLANKEDAEEAVNDTYLCACGLTEKAGTADVFHIEESIFVKNLTRKTFCFLPACARIEKE